MPPMAAPIPRGVLTDRSTVFFLFPTELTTLKQDMARTVQLDRKLIEATSSTPQASSMGFMRTPPPIPQIAPITEAPKLTDRKIKYVYMFLPPV